MAKCNQLTLLPFKGLNDLSWIFPHICQDHYTTYMASTSAPCWSPDSCIHLGSVQQPSDDVHKRCAIYTPNSLPNPLRSLLILMTFCHWLFYTIISSARWSFN